MRPTAASIPLIFEKIKNKSWGSDTVVAEIQSRDVEMTSLQMWRVANYSACCDWIRANLNPLSEMSPVFRFRDSTPIRWPSNVEPDQVTRRSTMGWFIASPSRFVTSPASFY
jgi:hypothetical protein